MLAYLTSGDEVVVTSTNGDYSCATYTGKGPKFPMTTGWLPTAALQAGAHEAGNAGWIGDWKASNDREIKIAASGSDILKIDTTSTFAWRLALANPDNPDESPGFKATVKPEGSMVSFSLDTEINKTGAFDADPASDDLCRAKFWLLGSYLVATDNRCEPLLDGSVAGVYRQAK